MLLAQVGSVILKASLESHGNRRMRRSSIVAVGITRRPSIAMIRHWTTATLHGSLPQPLLCLDITA